MSLPAKEEDVYQEYYLDHQRRKKRLLGGISTSCRAGRSLEEVLVERRSQRIFTYKRVDPEVVDFLLESAVHAPSNCNRQAVWLQPLSGRDDIWTLNTVLVGGRDWIGSAPNVILLWVDMQAYKSQAEKSFMPWIDVGVMVQTLLLTAEDMNLGACYVNPNMKDAYVEAFNNLFLLKDSFLFGGAIALGYYDLKAETPPKRASAVYLGKRNDNRC